MELKKIVTNEYVLLAALVIVGILGYNYYMEKKEAKKTTTTNTTTTTA